MFMFMLIVVSTYHELALTCDKRVSMRFRPTVTYR